MKSYLDIQELFKYDYYIQVILLTIQRNGQTIQVTILVLWGQRSKMTSWDDRKLKSDFSKTKIPTKLAQKLKNL